MVYRDREQAELEARSNERTLGGTWTVIHVEHRGWREKYATPGWWRPVRTDGPRREL